MSESIASTVRPDDSTAIALLKEQVAGLTHRLEALTSERDEYRDALEVIGEERDELAQASVTQDAKDTRIAELEGTLRLGKHRGAFEALAKKAGIREEALGDLFDLIRSKPGEFGADGKLFDADEADPKAYEGILAKAKESRGYAFIPTEGEAGGIPDRPTWPETSRFQPAQTPPVAGQGRGSRNTGGDGTIITAEMRGDPKFMLNPANQDMITAAAKEGRFR